MGHNSAQRAGHEFEYEVAELLRQQGYSEVEVTKSSNDWGADITAYLGTDKYAIQVKNWTKKVGARAISEVRLGKDHYECTHMMVITSSSFSPDAKDKAGQYDVELVDGATLETWRAIGNPYLARAAVRQPLPSSTPVFVAVTPPSPPPLPQPLPPSSKPLKAWEGPYDRMELFDDCIVISQSQEARSSDFIRKSDRRVRYELRHIEDMSLSIRLVQKGYRIEPGYEAYGNDFNNPGRGINWRKVSTLAISLSESFEGKKIKVDLYCDFGSFDALDEIFHRMHKVEDGKRLSSYSNDVFLVNLHREHLTILERARGLTRGTRRVYYKDITEVGGAEECYIITHDGQKFGDAIGYRDQLPVPRDVILRLLPKKKIGKIREQKVEPLANAPLLNAPLLFTFVSKPNWLGRTRLLRIYVDQLFETPQSGFGEVVCIPMSQIRGARIEINRVNPTARNSMLILDLTSGTSRHFSLPHDACLAAQEAISQAQLYNASLSTDGLETPEI